MAEISYYGPLERLCNGVGRSLASAVTAVISLRNRGAGLPDGGLFSAEQLRRAGGAGVAFDAQLPTHGAIEAKPAEDPLDRIVASAQVRRYLERYGKVLVTNFRQYQLVTLDREGRPLHHEVFELASSA